MNPMRIRVGVSVLVAVYVLVGLAFLSLPAFAEGLQPDGSGLVNDLTIGSAWDYAAGWEQIQPPSIKV